MYTCTFSNSSNSSSALVHQTTSSLLLRAGPLSSKCGFWKKVTDFDMNVVVHNPSVLSSPALVANCIRTGRDTNFPVLIPQAVGAGEEKGCMAGWLLHLASGSAARVLRVYCYSSLVPRLPAFFGVRRSPLLNLKPRLKAWGGLGTRQWTVGVHIVERCVSR